MTGRFSEDTCMESFGESNTSDVCVNFFDKFGCGTFVDVGANIGMIFIPVLSRSGCAGLAVEASPINFSWLQNNCNKNLPLQSVKLLNIAAGDHNGSVQLDANTINSETIKSLPRVN